MTALDRHGLAHLLTWVQDGIVSRRQLVELGAGPHDLRRMLRRGELFVHHPGVYVTHNGPPTWDQRAWAAVLHHAPAALDRESALPFPSPDAPIQVAVGLHRTLKPVPRVVVRPTAYLHIRNHSAPPRLRIEEATLNIVLSRIEVSAQFKAFADAVGTRQTTAGALAEALGSRPRVPGRVLLADLLRDLAAGACSVLEREWLRLERLHGLPAGSRQPRESVGGRTAYRDVRYVDLDTIVELDGRAHHDDARARDRDFERDLDTSVGSDTLTVRLTYGQVFDRGCLTVRRVASLLERRGWAGQFRPCPDCPKTA